MTKFAHNLKKLSLFIFVEKLDILIVGRVRFLDLERESETDFILR
jgi:hypothetical protein